MIQTEPKSGRTSFNQNSIRYAQVPTRLKESWIHNSTLISYDGVISGQAYREIAYRQLAGLYITVFVKEELLPVLKEVQTSRVGVGVMGMGNKGAVGVRFRISDSSFCFVNAHLAAEQHNVARRNQDFHDIMRCLTFSDETNPTSSVNTKSINDHE